GLDIETTYHWESPETEIVLAGKANFTHNPISAASFDKMFYQVVLVNQVADLGYNPGMHLVVGTQDTSAASRGWDILPFSSSLTSITMPKNAPYIAPYLTGGGHAALSIADWKFKLRVFGW
ncbi:MAG: hypothetical protein V7727_18255, partial [Sneathiella sp.]